MNVTLPPRPLSGVIEAIPSKSHVHRLLICAAFSDAPCKIICPVTSRDIEATADCLRSLGAQITREDGTYRVKPAVLHSRLEQFSLDCGESGSTLRFLLPVCAALGGRYSINMHGRLPERPLSPLYEILEDCGISLSPSGSCPLTLEGKLTERCFSIAGNVSSQFISGLLFASPLIGGECTVTLTTEAESRGYIDMTVESMRAFGVEVTETKREGRVCFKIKGSYTTPTEEIRAEGDWSNAAFWLVAGAVGKHPITVTGLSLRSLQPDRAVVDILAGFGAEIEQDGSSFTAHPSRLVGREADVSQTPDLAPVLCIAAACAEGETRITGGERLRIKESDRIASTCGMLRALGAEAEEHSDGMTVRGSGIRGGRVDSAGDHRIAMSAAVASVASEGEITVLGAECTEKSYPAFFEDLELLAQNKV